MRRGDNYQEQDEDTALYDPSSSINAKRQYDTITIESDHSHLQDDDYPETTAAISIHSLEGPNAAPTDPVSNSLMLGLALSVGFASMDLSLGYRLMNLIGAEFQQTDLAPWIHGAYLLCGLTTLPLAGNLADTLGRKPVLLTFTLLLLLGSWVTAFSRSMNQVIFARAIAGIGGGGLCLMGNVIVHISVPLDRRGPYQACITMAHTLGLALGAPLGRLIHDSLGWRYCYGLNTLPLLWSIGIFYVHMHHNLQQSTKSWRDKLSSIDFVGTGFLGLCSITLITCLLLGGSNPRDPRILFMISLSATCFVVLGLYEYFYGSVDSATPVFSVFCSKRNVTLASVGIFFACLTDGIMFLMPYFFEGVAGLEAGEADAWFSIETFSVPLGCGFAGYTLYRRGTFRTELVMYGMVSTTGLLLLSGWMVDAVPWVMGTLAMICVGFSMGYILVTLYMAAVSEIQESETTLAIAVVTMARFMAYCVGITVSSSIVHRHLKAQLIQRVGNANAEEIMRLVRNQIQRIHALSPEIQTAVADVLGQSLQKALFWITGAMVIATLTFALMKNVNLKASSLF
ncbi:major facilitator superfamily domain-containing protein [Dichotomocladium elegans]|nr:major facilitator superfamily domain-containing protein [Dichotomocladium elegans]